ncbi:MAG: T9SS type A sorting domain-containing protein [Candidatus Kapabacteria bacterium]|nr:T9SS type A sorting domain-containing protein [Candidatus Kapabacteria bacterium]
MQKLLLIPIALLCITAQPLIANPNGQNFSVKGGGCSCHSNNESSTTTTLVQPSKTTVKPGEQIDFVLSVQNATRSRSGFAFSVTDDAFVVVGTLTAGTGTRKLGTQLTHSSAKSFSGTPRAASWTFSWTAPTTPGVYTVYSVGNAANSGSSGDWRYSTPIKITVEDVQSVEDIGELDALYPNPASSSLTVPIPENMAGGTLTIKSADGRTVNSFNDVEQSFVWNTRSFNGDAVPAGVYYFIVDAGNRRRTQRAVIIR